MLLTFAVVGGFLYWLNMQADELDVAVVEEEAADVDDFSSAPTVDAGVFGSDPMAQAGGVIRIDDLLVQSAVGSQAFFVEMPNHAGPYLIKMGVRVVADSVAVPSGSQVSVIGSVYAMSDSVADDWVASGAITEADRILATFAPSFLEVVDILMEGDEGGDGEGGESEGS